MTLGQLHIIYYIRARGRKGERRGEEGNLAENRKAQWLGSTEGGREEERKGGGKEEKKGGKGERRRTKGRSFLML